MLYEEALEIIKRALVQKGKRLTEVHIKVLPLILENYSYDQIAGKVGYQYSYLKDVGADVCKWLSEAFGFKVRKLDLYPSVVRYAQQEQMCNTLASSQPKVDWEKAPDTSQLSGRQAESETLKQWILQDNSKVVAIAGDGGIGKTTLATQSAQQLADTGQFDIVVWRSLRQAPLLLDFLTELISAMAAPAVLGIAPQQSPQTSLEAAMEQLLEQLRAYRCLLVIDNLEAVLFANELAGEYKPGYQDYGWLFKQLAERQHQSSVMLTTREIPVEVAIEEGPTAQVRLLRLESLSVEQGATILASKGLLPAEQSQTWELVKRYQGNPLALKIVATVIQELFDGDIVAFLNQETLLCKDLCELLAKQFNRLSLVEHQMMYWLAINQEASAAQLEADLLPLFSRVELQNALVSLGRRSLIKKIKLPSVNPTALMSLDSVSYTQQPLVMAYVKEQLIEQTCLERPCADTNISGVERIKICTRRDTTSSGRSRKLSRVN